jgi:hypothetical protein
MTTYSYPQINRAVGYHWNMEMRIFDAIGIRPWSGDIQDSGVMKTLLNFDRDLTVPEKASVDAIMADNPTLPPTPTGTVFMIEDMWEKLSQFKSTTGVQFRIYYSETTPGSRVIDTIELHAPLVMTNAQKNNVRTAFTNLMTVT